MKKTALLLLLAIVAGQSHAAVDVNVATEAELDSVKGLSPSSTARILKAREQGPFKSWSDFTRRVKGLRPTTAARLSEAGLTMNQAPYDAPKAP